MFRGIWRWLWWGPGTGPGGTVCGTFSVSPAVTGTFSVSPAVTGTFAVEEC